MSVTESATVPGTFRQKTYVCTLCGANKVKLWRRTYGDSPGVLFCAACAETDAGQKFTIERSDQISGFVPAVPHEHVKGEYYPYAGVPARLAEWWNMLSFRPGYDGNDSPLDETFV